MLTVRIKNKTDYQRTARNLKSDFLKCLLDVLTLSALLFLLSSSLDDLLDAL